MKRLIKVFSIMKQNLELRKQVRYYRSELCIQINRNLRLERYQDEDHQENLMLRKVIEDYKRQGWSIDDKCGVCSVKD